MTSTRSMGRHAAATKWQNTATKVLLCAGIVFGMIMGIPPFQKAAEALMGTNIDNLLNWWLAIPFAAGMSKALILSALTIGASGVWQSHQVFILKMVALGLIGLFAYYILTMTPEAISIFLLGSVSPAIGTVAWALANAIQIKMLMLSNDDEATKKLISKTGAKQKDVDTSEMTPVQQRLSMRLVRDRPGEALSFFYGFVAISYIAEIAVNLIWGDGLMRFNWGGLLQPGGFTVSIFQLIVAVIVLLLTVRSIEWCVVALQHADDIEDAIKS